MNIEANTLPKLLFESGKKWKQKVAMREKHLGIWQEVSWEEYCLHVKYFALGLVELGLKKGGRVCIQSDNNWEWLFADLAIQSVGGVTVGVYPTNPAPELQYLIGDCQAEIFISENQEHVDKILKIRDKVPSLRHVIAMNVKGLKKYDDIKVIGFKDVETTGREQFDKDPDRIERLIAESSPDDPCTLIYTSGTTGDPKGSITTHRMTIESSMLLLNNGIIHLKDTDTYVSFLPLCHAFERVFSVTLHLLVGFTIHFAESVDSVPQNLQEVSPTFFSTVPRILEKMMASIEINIENASALKKWLYMWCLQKGYSISKNPHGSAVTALAKFFWRPILNLILRNPIKHFLGLKKVKFVLCAGSPLSPDLVRYFQAIGITIREAFGMTELNAITVMNYEKEIKIGTIGKIVPGWEFRIEKDGEIYFRGPGVTKGYWGKPLETEKVISPDGWLSTGDLFSIDSDGFLSIIGRKKDIIITSGGKNISPQFIENKLKASPFIREVVVVGDNRKFVSALIQIEMEVVGNWAKNRSIPYATIKDLSHNLEVMDLVRTEVAKVNEELSSVERLKRFALIDQELYQEEGDMTATQKTRRLALHNKFIKLIDALYSEHDSSGRSIDVSKMINIPKEHVLSV